MTVDCPTCEAAVDGHRVLDEGRCPECRVHHRLFFEGDAPDQEAVEIEYPVDEHAGVAGRE